jgi:hypothetical protein
MEWLRFRRSSLPAARKGLYTGQSNQERKGGQLSMRKADLRKDHRVFKQALAKYADLLVRLLHAQRVVSSTADKREIAEAVLLRICAHWEAFVDEQLIDCVNLDSSALATHIGLDLPKHLNKNMCEAILMRDGYLDFRSVGNIKGFARKVLVPKYNPFDKISNPTADKIDQVYKLRNYISHRSWASQRALMSMYSSKYKMRRFLEPGQFLLGYEAEKLAAYVEAFVDASNDMAKII